MYTAIYNAEFFDDERLGITLPDSLDYSNIAATNTCYSGSLFQIQEITTVFLQLNDISLVGRDLRWFSPLIYAGNWQILRSSGVINPDTGKVTFFADGTDSDEYRGTFTSLGATISRLSWHTIGDLSASPKLVQKGHIDNCNSATTTGSVKIGPVNLSATILLDNKNVFTQRIYDTPPPLKAKKFAPRLEALGLYISKGLSFKSARYTASIINVLEIDTQIEPAYTCQFIEEVDCNLEFSQYLIDNPQSFATEAEALAYLAANQPVGNGGVTLGGWVCSNGQLSKDIYTAIVNSGPV